MLSCGHDEKNWYSICSAHFEGHTDESCSRCNIGRCIVCHKEAAAIGERMKFFYKKDGNPANPFPNLGVRRA